MYGWLAILLIILIVILGYALLTQPSSLQHQLSAVLPMQPPPPKDQCVILMGSVGERPHVEYTRQINQRYAALHGYRFMFKELVLHPGDAPSWGKIYAIQEILKDYKYVIWIDDDAFFADKYKTFDPIFAIADGADVILCRDMAPVSMINTGVMIWKNSKYSHELLRKVAECPDYKNKTYHEQTTLERIAWADDRRTDDRRTIGDLHKGPLAKVLESGYPVCDNHICVMHENVMNSHHSSFIVHMAGIPNSQRVKLIQANQWTPKLVYPWSSEISRDNVTLPRHITRHHKDSLRTIHQTFETPVVPSHIGYNIGTWLEKNPNYNWRYWTTKRSRKFISKNFSPRVLQAYDSLIPGAYKADIWRCCCVYIYGGVYADIKMVCQAPLSAFIQTHTFVLDKIDVPKAMIYNAFFAAPRGSPILREILEEMVTRVEKKEYGEGSLDITGPLAWGCAIYRCLNKTPVMKVGDYDTPYGKVHFLQHVSQQRVVDKDGAVVLHTRNPHVPYDKERGLFANITGVPHYGELWEKRKVFV